MLIAVNGALQTETTALVDVNDGGFLHGDSLFETIRAEGQQLFWVKEHLDRLEESCRLCELPFDRDVAERSLEQVSCRIECPAARVRLTVSRGPGKDSVSTDEQGGFHLVTAQPYTPPAAEQYQNGIDCSIAPNRRVKAVSNLPQMKRGNYADCLYALKHARSHGSFEAIFCEPDGQLLEGAISNLFILLDGVLVTPPAGGLVLPGIARQQIIRVAGTMGLSTLEHPIHCDQLPHAGEAFITNSLFGLLPVRKIARFKLPPAVISQQIRQQLGGPFFRPE